MVRKARRLLNSAETSEALFAELDAALANPNEIFGYGRYGDGRRWVQLDKMTGGLQPNSFAVVAARPKRGKSMWVSDLVPLIARQALDEDKVVRVISLEMPRLPYQRRMAAIMAGIPDPKNIRRGFLTEDEQRRYRRALTDLANLPIEYLSVEKELDEEESMQFGNSPITFRDVADFVRGKGDTYWWSLDHIGLLSDLNEDGDITRGLFSLANKLQVLAHTTAAGLVVTHLTRASTGTIALPTIESIAGSDQVGRNADQIFLLSRPYMDAGAISEEDRASIESGEPAFLQFYSRDEGGGLLLLWWKSEYAHFDEMEVPPDVSILDAVPLPERTRKRLGAQ